MSLPCLKSFIGSLLPSAFGMKSASLGSISSLPTPTKAILAPAHFVIWSIFSQYFLAVAKPEVAGPENQPGLRSMSHSPPPPSSVSSMFCHSVQWFSPCLLTIQVVTNSLGIFLDVSSSGSVSLWVYVPHSQVVARTRGWYSANPCSRRFSQIIKASSPWNLMSRQCGTHPQDREVSCQKLRGAVATP